jgi:gamma-glutamyl-gamma-aminobutyrate hydrolase PuuD
MGRPIIGITGELEAARWGNWIREAVVSAVSYTRAVERAGGTPVVLPPVPAHSVPGLVAALDAVVFTGGGDIDPALYDEEPHEQTDQVDHRRDRFELVLMRAAIEADLPFLAIGRGMHVLNVARGGTLTQHLPDRIGNDSHRPDPVKLTAHEVQLSAASRVGRALSASEARVQGGHHQAINRIGSGLLTVAWTSDQVVEGIELQGHAFGVGVQWHPEEADGLPLFEALTGAASSATATTEPPAVPAEAPAQPSASPQSAGPAQTSAAADGAVDETQATPAGDTTSTSKKRHRRHAARSLRTGTGSLGTQAQARC